jgi:hypothetical protein
MLDILTPSSASSDSVSGIGAEGRIRLAGFASIPRADDPARKGRKEIFHACLRHQLGPLT